MAERFDRIWHNARLATLRGDLPDLGVIEHGVIAVRGGRIAFAGSGSDVSNLEDEHVNVWTRRGRKRRHNVNVQRGGRTWRRD